MDLGKWCSSRALRCSSRAHGLLPSMGRRGNKRDKRERGVVAENQECCKEKQSNGVDSGELMILLRIGV